MPPNKMERFTAGARRVLFLAQDEAERLKHNYIGTEHLLLGLMREEDGIAGRVLRDLGLELRRVEELVVELTGARPPMPATTLDLSPGTKRVLELTVEEAHELGHHYVGTEHLLLGLLRQSESGAIKVLKHFKIEPEELRQRILKRLEESPVQNTRPTEGQPEAPPSNPTPHQPQPARPPMFTYSSNAAALAILESTINRILDMVEAEKLTTAQAAELLTALQPDLVLSTGQKVQLVAQALKTTDLKKRRLRVVIRNITTREVLFESSMSLQDTTVNLDTLINAILTGHAGWYWAEDIDANSQVEFQIDEDSTQSESPNKG
jgi:ClpA/ClpB-like protein/SHOCT-like protein